VEPLPRLFPAQAERCVVERGKACFQAELEVVTHLQQTINKYELTDMEVLEMLHRLVGVGISRVSGGCVAEDA